MHLLLEDRVEQAFRYLQPSDAKHITKIIQALKQESFENLRTRFNIHKLSSPGEQGWLSAYGFFLNILKIKR